jgi:hypothetical protein
MIIFLSYSENAKVSNKSPTGKQNTHFRFKTFFLPKIRYNRAGHRRQYNTEHAHFMFGNWDYRHTQMYECVSKIFRTGAAIYAAVVVARSTGPNRTNCEVWVLRVLRSFAATAWKRAKTSPRTLARTNLAASPWQRPVSHFRPHPAVSGEIQNGCHPQSNVLPW